MTVIELKRKLSFILSYFDSAKKNLQLSLLAKPKSEALWAKIQSMDAVFCLSTGRAGTKLLTKILRTNPELWVEHSPFPELAHHSSLIYESKISDEVLRWSFIHARLDILRQVSQAELRYVETNNRISLYAPAVAQLLPNSKFLHIVRHPAEFVRSGMCRGYYERINPELAGHLRPRQEDPLSELWPSLHRIEKIAWQWNEINSEIEIFKKSLSANRYLLITSEQLFNDPQIYEIIGRFAGINLPLSTKLKKLRRTKVNKQKRKSFPRYSQWNEQQREMLINYAKLAKKYGFKL